MNKIFLVAVLSAVLILFGCSQEQNVISDQPVLGEEIEENVVGQDVVAAVVENSEETINEVTLFDVHGSNYKFNPVEIRVKKGETVKINFENDEGTHNFIIDGLNIRTQTISSGNVDTVTFTADEVGEFEVYCGFGNHRELGMKGTLIVEN